MDIPGESASESVTVPVAEGGVGIVRLMDPSLKADNGFAFHLPQVGASRVLVVDGDQGPILFSAKSTFWSEPWPLGWLWS